MPTILLLSKDIDYRDLALSYFENRELEFCHTDSIQEAKEIINERNIDLVLCDYNFGSISVMQVAEIIHSIDMNILIASLGDCFGNLNLSAFIDGNIKEYICKKSDLQLTELRLVQLLNNKDITPYKGKNSDNLISHAENIEINLEQNTIYHHSKAIHVTQLEFNLLILFLENKNKLLKREHIIENIWKENNEANLRKVDSFVKKLRQKLNLKSIKSIRGLGYKWVE